MKQTLTHDRVQWQRQREIPEEDLRDATAKYGMPAQSRERARDSALVFRIGVEWLALPTVVFDEVTEPRTPHSLPMRRSGALLGVVNVRGQLLACVSLAVLLGIDVPGTESRTDARLMVLRQPGQRRVACPADKVHGVWTYGATDLAGPPTALNQAEVRYTRALMSWQEQTVALLDHEPLLKAVEQSLP